MRAVSVIWPSTTEGKVPPNLHTYSLYKVPFHGMNVNLCMLLDQCSAGQRNVLETPRLY